MVYVSIVVVDGVQDVINRMVDSVIGFWKADFIEKTTDNADL